MEHYVVMCDWAISDSFVDCGVDITGIAHSMAEAKEILAKAIVDEKKYAEDNNWIIYEDSEIEFDAVEDGNYTEEHAHFYIAEVK